MFAYMHVCVYERMVYLRIDACMYILCMHCVSYVHALCVICVCIVSYEHACIMHNACVHYIKSILKENFFFFNQYNLQMKKTKKN